MNIIKLNAEQLDGPASIVEQLRGMADAIERGEIEARTLFIVMRRQDNGISSYCYGYRPVKSDIMGMLEFAKLQVWDE